MLKSYTCLVGYILLFSFSGITSQRINYESLPQLKTEDCYQSLADPAIMFKLYHNHHTGPRYLRTKVLYILDPLPPKRSSVFKNVEHHFVRTSTMFCRNSLVFTAGSTPYSHMLIHIEMFLGFEERRFAIFHYTFDQKYTYNIDKMYDQHRQFAVSVETRFAGDYVQTASSYSIDKVKAHLSKSFSLNFGICVVTPSHQPVILRPYYDKVSSPPGLVTEIIAEYSSHGERDKFVSYPAFECDYRVFGSPGFVAVVEEGLEQDDIKLMANVTPYTSDADFTYPFTVKNGYFVSIDKLVVNRNKSYLFLIMHKAEITYCHHNIQQLQYRSDRGTFLYGHESRNSKITAGVIGAGLFDRLKPEVCAP